MELLDLLEETRDTTAGYFDLSAKELLKTYGQGKWTVKEILVHLADAESVLLDRIKRVIAEPGKVIWAFDQDLWCTHLEYNIYPLDISRSQYLVSRQSIIYLAERYYHELRDREFVHSETGLRTLSDEFSKVAYHNLSHLNQINRALQER